jgi:hypothetical protein
MKYNIKAMRLCNWYCCNISQYQMRKGTIRTCIAIIIPRIASAVNLPLGTCKFVHVFLCFARRNCGTICAYCINSRIIACTCRNRLVIKDKILANLYRNRLAIKGRIMSSLYRNILAIKEKIMP